MTRVRVLRMDGTRVVVEVPDRLCWEVNVWCPADESQAHHLVVADTLADARAIGRSMLCDGDELDGIRRLGRDEVAVWILHGADLVAEPAR
jgi:hypothetical protein